MGSSKDPRAINDQRTEQRLDEELERKAAAYVDLLHEQRERAEYLQHEINKMRRVMQDAGTWDQFCKDYATYTGGDRIDN